MTVRFATSEERANWNKLILANPDGGNVFSSFEYAEQKRLTGYTPRFIMVSGYAVTVLEKKTPPLGKLWYLPKGPNVTTPKQLFDVLKELHRFASRRGVFVIRVESEIDRQYVNTLTRKGMQKAAPIIPNPSTILLDISSPLDQLLTSLPQKGRHAIRRAERDGVIVKQVKASAKNCQIMYRLLEETAEGQFGIRSYDYFKTFWQRFEKAGLGQLFLAYVNDKPVAGAFAMVFGTKSTYKDGASVRHRTVYGASHLLQWHVIEWAKSKGATIHDFCGSPPSDEINNTQHPHYGVGRFKLSFSKQVVDYIGCYDWIIGSFRHKLWTMLAERLYRKLYFQRTKDYYY